VLLVRPIQHRTGDTCQSINLWASATARPIFIVVRIVSDSKAEKAKAVAEARCSTGDAREGAEVRVQFVGAAVTGSCRRLGGNRRRRHDGGAEDATSTTRDRKNGAIEEAMQVRRKCNRHGEEKDGLLNQLPMPVVTLLISSTQPVQATVAFTLEEL
jgi:hypothetical protein